MLVYAVNETIGRGWRSPWTTIPLAAALLDIGGFGFNELPSRALVPLRKCCGGWNERLTMPHAFLSSLAPV